MKRVWQRARGALKSRFLRESSTLQVASIVTAFGNVAGSVVLARVLGGAELGVFYLAVSVYALFWSLLNLGLAPVATMKVAGAVRSGDRERLRSEVGLHLRLSGVLAVLATSLAGVSLLLPSDGLAVRLFDLDGPRIFTLAALLGIAPLFETLRNLCVAGLLGERRMAPLARVEVGQEICRVCFVCAGAIATGSALGAVLGQIAGNACGCVLSLDAFERERRRQDSILPSLRGALRAESTRAWPAIKEGAKVGLVRNVDQLGVQTIPSLLLGALVGDKNLVAYLRIAQRFGGMLRLLMLGINRTALPALSQLAHVKDLAGLRRTYWRSSFLSGAVVSLGLVVALPLLPYVIESLYSEEFHAPVFTLVLLLSPGIAITSFSVANDVFYLVTQQMRVAIALSLLGFAYSVLVVAACIAQWPEVGAAIGLSAACLWALVHMGYAGRWLHAHGGEARAVPRTV